MKKIGVSIIIPGVRVHGGMVVVSSWNTHAPSHARYGRRAASILVATRPCDGCRCDERKGNSRTAASTGRTPSFDLGGDKGRCKHDANASIRLS